MGSDDVPPLPSEGFLDDLDAVSTRTMSISAIQNSAPPQPNGLVGTPQNPYKGEQSEEQLFDKVLKPWRISAYIVLGIIVLSIAVGVVWAFSSRFSARRSLEKQYQEAVSSINRAQTNLTNEIKVTKAAAHGLPSIFPYSDEAQTFENVWKSASTFSQNIPPAASTAPETPQEVNSAIGILNQYASSAADYTAKLQRMFKTVCASDAQQLFNNKKSALEKALAAAVSQSQQVETAEQSAQSIVAAQQAQAQQQNQPGQPEAAPAADKPANNNQNNAQANNQNNAQGEQGDNAPQPPALPIDQTTVQRLQSDITQVQEFLAKPNPPNPYEMAVTADKMNEWSGRLAADTTATQKALASAQQEFTVIQNSNNLKPGSPQLQSENGQVPAAIQGMWRVKSLSGARETGGTVTFTSTTWQGQQVTISNNTINNLPQENGASPVGAWQLTARPGNFGSISATLVLYVNNGKETLTMTTPQESWTLVR